MSARFRLSKILTQKAAKAKYKPKPPETNHWNIVRGDRVQVIAPDHLEKGKQGIVLQVLRARNRVLVEGINVAPKHIKGDTERGIKGRTIQRERTIPYSAVNLVDPETNQPTRVVRKILPDGSKVRISKKSGAVIPRPGILQVRKRPFNQVETESCTLDADVWEVTYKLKNLDTNETK